jgi:PAS domain S-box-containing protein
VQRTPGQRRRRLAFDLGPIAELVIDAAGNLRQANQQARQLLGIRNEDLGTRSSELEWWHRPVDLGPMSERSRRTGQGEVVRGVSATTPDGQHLILDVQMIALVSEREFLGTVVTFTDVSELHRLRGHVERSEEGFENVIEELRFTRTQLERISEDLQASDEALKLTSEELTSSSEELEVTSEELRSEIEESERTSDELRLRTSDLAALKRLLDSVVDALGAAFVLDEDLTIRLWSRECEELWGVHHGDVHDRRLQDIQVGLPARPLEAIVRSVMTDGEPAEAVLDARDRHGVSFPCRVSASPLSASGGAREGVIILVRRDPVAG